MPYKNRRSTYSSFILIFVLIKIGLNLLAIAHFGFHRDEFLHLVLADHLDWGYKEVPPFIALLAKITISIFGNSVFAARIFPTIAGGFIIWFTGQITVELGGKRFAVALACLALIFSPAFAASDYLFQPVVFDQLWWVLAVWLLVKYCNTSSVKYLYFLGMAVGVGMLTKYSMAFFTFSLLFGILISKQRKMLFNRHILGGALVALLIWLPNIIWQFQHHLPVFTHMSTLQKEQLDYIQPFDYIKQELMVNGIALFVWLTGFIFLLFSFRLHKFQFLAIAFVLIFTFLLVMHGKSYYLFGAYPMLFAAGGFGFERWLKASGYTIRGLTIALFTIPNLILLPLVLPIFSLNQTLAIFRYMHDHTTAFRFAVTWEDHKEHATTQDYADMLGWDEMAAKVDSAWKTLTPEQQKHTQIYADNYGEAGALHHYDKQYNLPEVISLNSSFTLWAPDNLDGEYIIYVDDQGGGNINSFKSALESYRKIGEVENPLAREKGTAVFILVHPKKGLTDRYSKELARKRLE
ncbi:glycosyltransferase family 39 protein [Mucilaginibacter gotjawali]|uniref:Dolichyl-phosphate-mannose-protein mannosyltransferase n=1 Tax=Mucilaginibacter gotjawali TaxID=1550579 RepID=A0A120MYI4_9SPHI|nr:glycosyltransferase family 39 protein [Mucilaginibacter gotjawali]BAU55167.1 Dolichyl-phosphate-mannose-protein mannosyltransferase [Mucilaginibacter gotjawali]